MDFIEKIRELYQGNILLQPPYLGEGEEIPEELLLILRISNGIEETMIHPKSGEKIVIGWVIYPYEIIVSDTRFYRKEYQMDGTVFSTDGAGNPYLLKPDGTVSCLDGIDGIETKISNSLANFYK